METHVTTKGDVAPGDLEVLRLFLNTWDIEARTDALSSVAGLRDWLAAVSLPAGDGTFTAEDLEVATWLRESIRALLRNRPDQGRLESAAADFTQAARQVAPLRVQPSAGLRASLVPDPGAPRAALGRITGLVAEYIGTPHWERLRVCDNPQCQWAFYDHAANKTGRWCNMATCGNRAKARAYRNRKAVVNPTP